MPDEVLMGGKNNRFHVGTNNNTSFYYSIEPYQDIFPDLWEIEEKKSGGFHIIEYSPFLFGSLYTKTPKEEFNLLYESSCSHDFCDKDKCVRERLAWWHLDSVADLNFHKLSGGYRKFVFIATQIEARQQKENIIAINIQQQLDATRFKIIEKSIVGKGVNSVLWVDDNTNLLLQKSGFSPQEITFNDWVHSV